MSAYLFFDPMPRPLSISGAIMPGCYLQFYESGTTTPTNVYADAGLTTPLSNPVVADSDGRFVAIYLDPVTTYRVQLFDEDDVLQFDVDPIAPPRDFMPGTVLMFEGTAEERDAAYPPALWQVMNGENGSTDARDRFPICVSSTKESGDTGGSAEETTSGSGAHDHGGAVSETVLSSATMPVHNHRFFAANNNVSSKADGWARSGSRGISSEDIGPFAYRDQSDTGDQIIEDSGEVTPEGHAHNITAVVDHTHTVSVTPPWFAVWFIKRRLPV